ncbi:hypothetical protein BKA82DRAFT_4087070 [Pisolithus tinctorius]|nr:hypothetical protein BKA82DRAFT_4087070 [Pisolithus tinctorius]
MSSLWRGVRARNIDVGQWGSCRTALSSDNGRIRAFHSSPRALTPSESYAVDDHTVPDFYIRHKLGRKGNSNLPSSSSASSVSQTLSSSQLRTDTTADPASVTQHDNPSSLTTRSIKARKHEEGPLMKQLFDSVLSDQILASTRRLKAKIPVEHYDRTHDLIRHPSGFVVPGNGHASASDAARAKEHARDEVEDRAVQTTNVAERVRESDLDSVHAACASTRPRMSKVPCEVREPDGTFKHPSGFVPPTSVQEFERVGTCALVVRQRILHDSGR